MDEFYDSTTEMNMPFTGAKIALLIEDRVVVILRDDRSDIPYPDFWDLPGGGRIGMETPLECALRETQEELGLSVPHAAIQAARPFKTGKNEVWFFVAQLPPELLQQIVFGEEGQCWALMQVARFLRHPWAVPRFQERLRICLSEDFDLKNPPLF